MSSATQCVVLVDISGGFFFSSFNIHTLVALYSRFYFGVSFLGWGWGLACHTTSSGLTQGPGLWSVCRASWPRLCPHIFHLQNLSIVPTVFFEAIFPPYLKVQSRIKLESHIVFSYEVFFKSPLSLGLQGDPTSPF